MNKIREEFFRLKDQKCKDFILSLTPTMNPDMVLGVRIPYIRQIEKKLSLAEKESYLKIFPFEYLEERMLIGIILNNNMRKVENYLVYLEKYSDIADSWVETDILKIPQLKGIDVKEWIYEKLLSSNKPYKVRIGINFLRQGFTKDNFKESDLCFLKEFLNTGMSKIANNNSQHYYIKMAIAWYVTEAFVYNQDLVKKYISEKHFEKDVLSMIKRKIKDSRKLDPEVKKYI